MSKNNFSSQSDQYAKYRPGYPAAFFEYLNTILTGTQNAWDCGTGNGQVATVLAKMFDTVYATDISQSQLDNAARADNIIYSVQAAEQTDFPDHHFDLVVVAQAIHWFDFEKFYAEVKRTCKENALLIVIGYGILHVSPEIDAVIGRFYKNVIGPYWDKERRYIDEQYLTIRFPFEEIQTPQFSNTYTWTIERLIGYLNTWSAVKHFTRQNGMNPVDDLRKEIAAVWMQEEIEVSFPLLLRVGRV
jgi:SAM-dependent methyltransferase